MRILLKSVLIQDSQSEFHGQRVDMLADAGRWIQIAHSIQEKADICIEQSGLSWIPSVVDVRVHHTLPGGEYREDWNSLASAAKKGGVLDMMLLPTGNPVPQQPEAIQLIQSKSSEFGIHFHPMAPLSIDNQGENFSDLFDLNRAGANWFSHGDGSLQSVDLMAKSLQYLQTLPVTLVSRPDTSGLSMYGQIHEGLQSTLLGLKGIPVLSETLSIQRDLDLLAYVLGNSFGHTHANFRLHFSCLSSSDSVDLIRQAKKKGLPVSADVAIHSLVYTEDAVSGFDTLKKVNPPFRSEKDLTALWKGISDGTIDAVVSDHCPHEQEAKELEFDHAAFGSIGLETLFLMWKKQAQARKIPNWDRLIAANPASLAGMGSTGVAVGQVVKGIVSQEVESYVYQSTDIVGKSKNSAFIGETFTDRILHVMHGENILYSI
ncbi:MAG: Dihydroorotase [Bacteroidota bacterium]